MKKLFFTLALVVAGLSTAYSQEYKSAIGLRLGAPLSISYKQFLGDSPGAIEVFAGFRNYAYYGWFNVGGLYQYHFDLSNVTPGLKWYVGGGVSAFFWKFDDGFFNDNATNTSFGILGNIGLDYKFVNAPVNLSADWVPAVFLNGYGNGFGAGYGALSVRYTFK